MTINLSTDEVLLFRDAAKKLPGRPHAATVARWATQGVKGIVLESAFCGGRRVTSFRSLQEFLERVSAANSPRGRTARDRQRGSRRAGRVLRDAKI